MKTAPLIVLSAAALAAVARDRNHAHVLDEDFFVGTFRETFRSRGRDLPVLDAETGRLRIRARELWILSGATGDGATLCPDRVGRLDLAPAFIPHDELYERMEELAALPEWRAAGWTREDVRLLADTVFNRMLRREESRCGLRLGWLSRAAFAAARLFGSLWHRAAAVFGLCVIAVAAGAETVFEPSGADPAYHLVETGLSTSTVLTFGGILLLMQLANMAINIWSKLRRQPPIDRTLQDYVRRDEFERARDELRATQGQCFELLREQERRSSEWQRTISMQIGRIEAAVNQRNP